MLARTYQEIMSVIANYQQQSFVDVSAIADALGIKVIEASNWPDKLCGKIVKDKTYDSPSGYTVFINGKHSIKRQRFTLAHEIAHFILHQDDIGDGIADDALYRSGLNNVQESMANKLAADILMPWDLINKKIKEGLDTVEKLSEAFKVSTSAMAIRLGVPSQAD